MSINPRKLINLKSNTHRWAIVKAITGALLIALPQVRESFTLADYGMITAFIMVVDVTLRNITKLPIDQR